MGVTLNGFLRCASESEADRVRAALPEHVRLTRAEPGCVRFDVVPTDDPLVWTVSEAFTDPAAFKAHQARAAKSDWARDTAGIARDYTIKGME
ncbi:putative quinol monooxygenase [Tateyamaria omphalii]|uniref:Antibiotic biosynthesis monooxygenase n=1 Tax=Tateyamaria omphalii TaxID=299262 RepID=A0A1P8MUJ9_9RHOB|nr:putative quinol monooxygenase [Tateyamaria omphalii]APX11609.1 antibiotic biosynthesis monooxygenase [Tateyamaria omphalii]